MRRCPIVRQTPCPSSLGGRHNHRRHFTHSPACLSVSSTSKTHRPDPFTLVAPELTQVRTTIVDLLGASHPKLEQVAKYYFLQPSKLLRPLLILLFSQATNGLGQKWPKKLWLSQQDGPGGRFGELNRPISRRDVLNDFNPTFADLTQSVQPDFLPNTPLSNTGSLKASYPEELHPNSSPSVVNPSIILPSQIRLAQIVEMLHAASLLHDDVVDESPLRRGVPSAPAAFGTKLSILGGNFVLGRASAALARLGDADATELIASVIAKLVEGELLQLKDVLESDLTAPQDRTKSPWTIYMQKTYMKTASLMAKGARAAVTLGGCEEGEIYREVAYAYGRNLGLAFQLIDDVLDYEAGEASLGKPGGADLQLGLATGPALYAWEEHPELGPLIQRKFENEGDVELARGYVRRSSGVERTRALAQAYALQARDVLKPLPDSDAKSALEALTDRVISRKS